MAVNVSGGGAAGGTPAPVLSTTNAAGSASTFLRTDDQLAIFDATVPVTQASADAAAAGTAAIAARRDHKHGMPTLAAAAGVTRAGGNTTEATTTSTTSADLLSIASLSIAANVPVELVAELRKTTGAANTASAGLKVNATAVRSPYGWSDANNLAGSAGYYARFQSAQTNYTGQGEIQLWSAAGGQQSQVFGAALPVATITDLVLTALVGDALITAAADEFHAYTRAVS